MYTAIVRVSKVAYIMMGTDKRKDTGAKFLKKVIEYYQYKINYILTDNGFEFSYRVLAPRKRTKKVHPFDKICIQNKIQHRTIEFRHPWTNCMVERFNRTLMGKVLDRQIVL
jgi:transposase InsO family protein